MLGFLLLAGCLRAPSADVTDEYIKVVKPGQTLGLVEIDAGNMDSTFGYQIDEREVAAYSIVDRGSHEDVNGDVSLKIYFEEYYANYCWKIQRVPFSGFQFADTIHLKPFTWYKLVTENTNSINYLYWKGVKGEYVLKFKPKPGAW